MHQQSLYKPLFYGVSERIFKEDAFFRVPEHICIVLTRDHAVRNVGLAMFEWYRAALFHSSWHRHRQPS